jgi:hypothetical protein
MELLQFHPIHAPPRSGEGGWPSEAKRNERWSQLRSGHVAKFRDCYTRVVDAVPPLFLQAIKFDQLPNPKAFTSVLDFHAIGPGDGENDAQIQAYLKSQAEGLILFGPPRTAKTRAVFGRLSQLYVWGTGEFRWIPGYELARLTVDEENLYHPSSLFSELARYDEVLFIDDLDVAKFNREHAEALFRLVDYRVSMELSTVVTMVSSGDEFVDRVAGKCSRHIKYLAEGIVGRLRDSCSCVDFGHGMS